MKQLFYVIVMPLALTAMESIILEKGISNISIAGNTYDSASGKTVNISHPLELVLHHEYSKTEIDTVVNACLKVSQATLESSSHDVWKHWEIQDSSLQDKRRGVFTYKASTKYDSKKDIFKQHIIKSFADKPELKYLRDSESIPTKKSVVVKYKNGIASLKSFTISFKNKSGIKVVQHFTDLQPGCYVVGTLE